jgi:hypothetical protein
MHEFINRELQKRLAIAKCNVASYPFHSSITLQLILIKFANFRIFLVTDNAELQRATDTATGSFFLRAVNIE